MKNKMLVVYHVDPPPNALDEGIDPLIVTGKGLFKEKYFDYKIIFKGYQPKLKLFGDYYKEQTLILNETLKFKFLGFAITGDCYLYDVTKPNSLIDERKIYLIFED